MAPIAVILAAGKSTRMKSKCPKALHEVASQCCNSCWTPVTRRAVVPRVAGGGPWQGRNHCALREGDERIQWVEQAEQLGTGHAARVCEPQLRQHHGDVFILTGDALIRGEVLRTLLRTHREEHANASMATAILDDPTGYGRVVRDAGPVRPYRRADRRHAAGARNPRGFPSYYCFKGKTCCSPCRV